MLRASKETSQTLEDQKYGTAGNLRLLYSSAWGSHSRIGCRSCRGRTAERRNAIRSDRVKDQGRSLLSPVERKDQRARGSGARGDRGNRGQWAAQRPQRRDRQADRADGDAVTAVWRLYRPRGRWRQGGRQRPLISAISLQRRAVSCRVAL